VLPLSPSSRAGTPQPPDGCAWNKQHTHYICTKCGNHSPGISHTAFNCRGGKKWPPNPQQVGGDITKSGRDDTGSPTLAVNRRPGLQSKAAHEREALAADPPADNLSSDYKELIACSHRAHKDGETMFFYDSQVYSFDPHTGDVTLLVPVANALSGYDPPGSM